MSDLFSGAIIPVDACESSREWSFGPGGRTPPTPARTYPPRCCRRPVNNNAWLKRRAAALNLRNLIGRGLKPLQRSLAWLVGYRRLQVRYERRADVLLGFLHLACALICLKSLNQPNATGPFGS
jgi:hypothetical protein